MSDPVLTAARRAVDSRAAFVDPPEAPLHYAFNGAREALKLVRELHRPEPSSYGDVWCSCGCGDPFLDRLWRDCPTAKVCYSADELKNA